MFYRPLDTIQSTKYNSSSLVKLEQLSGDLIILEMSDVWKTHSLVNVSTENTTEIYLTDRENTFLFTSVSQSIQPTTG